MSFEPVILLKGLLIGVLTTIPVGPIGLLCINRTLNNGRLSGFLTGLGAATSDTLYAILAGWGLAVVIQFVENEQLYFNIIGSLVIIGLGMLIFFSNPVKQFRKSKPQEKRINWYFFSGFLLTLSNPVVLLVFLAVFTTLNLESASSFNPLLTVAAGIFTGAVLGWFGVSTLFARLRRNMRLRKSFWFNKIAGAASFTFGFVTILGFLFTL